VTAPTASAQPITLTFHAAVPVGEKVTAAPFVDDESKYAAPIELTVNDASAAYADHAGFSHYTINATFLVPPKDALPIPSNPGFVRMRYGLTLTSGDEEEKIVGNYLVYSEGAPELAWTQVPDVTVSSPAEDATVSGETDLEASIGETLDDNWRVGWFVSDGKVTNRRAADTKWETDDSGPQTVIFTARGRKSGAFMIKVVDVTVD
jgi:hypothetical protein